MTASSHTGRLALLVFLLIAIFSALAIGIGLSYTLTQPAMEVDSGLFAEFARIQLHGGVLYRDLYDNKPPGIFFYLVPFLAMLGNTTQAIKVAIVVLDVAFGLAVAALVYAVTRHRAATVAGLLVALLYSVTIIKPETTLLMATCSALAMACVAYGKGHPGWTLAGGVFFSAGVWTKQPIIVEAPALLLFTLVMTPRSQWWRSVIGLGTGIVLGSAVVLGWAAANGVLEAMWHHTFSTVRQYVFTETGSWHFSDESPAVIQNTLLGNTLPRFLPLLVSSAVAFWLLWQKHDSRKRLLVIAFWTALCLGAAFMGRSMKPDYYMQMVPPMALLIGMAMPLVAQTGGLKRLLVAVVTGALVGVYIGNYIHPSVYDGGWIHPQTETVAFIQENVPEDGCLWTWGYLNNFNFWSGRASCASAPYNGHVMDANLFPIRENRLLYMQEMVDKYPSLLLETYEWGFFPQLQDYADRYVGPLVFEHEGYQIYTVDRSMWHPADANFGNEIRFIGYDLLPLEGPYCPDDTLTLAMTWQQISTPSHQYQMFVQLLTQDETARVAGYDGPPEDDRRSNATNTWVDVGEIRLGERFDMAIPADVAPGTYKLIVGLYDVEAPDQRVPMLDANGAQVGSYALLQELEISNCE